MLHIPYASTLFRKIYFLGLWTLNFLRYPKICLGFMKIVHYPDSASGYILYFFPSCALLVQTVCTCPVHALCVFDQELSSFFIPFLLIVICRTSYKIRSILLKLFLFKSVIVFANYSLQYCVNFSWISSSLFAICIWRRSILVHIIFPSC